MVRISLTLLAVCALAVPAMAQGAGWIGMTVADGQTEGAVIRSVEPDSPASRAGLEPNDLILEYNQVPVLGSTQFSRLVRETPAGRTVTMRIRRGSESREVQITTEERPNALRSFRINPEGLRTLEAFRVDPDALRSFERFRDLGDLVRRSTPEIHVVTSFSDWGLRVDGMTSQLREYFGAGDNGVLVTAVEADSPAGRAGLRAGDVIIAVNGLDVRQPSDLMDDLRTRADQVTVHILRDRQQQELTLERNREPR